MLGCECVNLLGTRQEQQRLMERRRKQQQAGNFYKILTLKRIGLRASFAVYPSIFDKAGETLIEVPTFFPFVKLASIIASLVLENLVLVFADASIIWRKTDFDLIKTCPVSIRTSLDLVKTSLESIKKVLLWLKQDLF